MPSHAQFRVRLFRDGASQPATEPAAKVVRIPGNGDCLFNALSYTKVVCVDGKPCPESEDRRHCH